MNFEPPDDDFDAPEPGVPQLTDVVRQVRVPAAAVGQRIDLFLTRLLDGFSRQQLCDAVQAGAAEVDGRLVRPSHRVREGQTIRFRLPAPATDDTIPENIPLDILHEDDGMVVINKAARMVVHPARGNWTGTLTSALAYRFQSLSDIGGPTRPGIVHRLDRDTSGVIVVAKTNAVHLHLAQQWHDREVQKEYLAIAVGRIDRDRDLIEAMIGKHPFQREKMAIRDRHASSRHAKTFYEVLERFARYSFVKAMPETGRTHQIRVHLEYIGRPILCDRLYAGHAEVTRSQLLGSQPQKGEEPILSRHALHASRLTLRHPKTGKLMEFHAPLPQDLSAVLDVLRQGPDPLRQGPDPLRQGAAP
ncbi:MAG: ribosomal large subunit pseudouridine synthase [Planctomycetota bacterium]